MNIATSQEHRTDILTRAAFVEDVPSADKLVAALRKAGLPEERLAIISDTDHVRERTRGVDVQPSAGRRTVTAIGTGAFAGLLIGAVGAAMAGLFSGTQAQLLVGSLFPFAAALVGGFIGAMMTRGMENETANFHDQEAQPGQVLVAVELHADDPELWTRTAEATIRRFGAKPLQLPPG